MEEVRQKMTKALQLFQQELGSLNVGQPSPALIERVMVEAYETRMPLVELATITTTGPNQLLVTPFDQSITRNIERALAMERNLGLVVRVEENAIRVQVPPLTQERRQEFAKILHQKLEAVRIMIRQIRREAMSSIEQEFEAKQLSEDEKFRAQQESQKITDEFNEKIEEMGRRKEEELLSI